ncbi:GNAT family N-acetyltransferase [Alicyclobacillus ferrooxydans]|uniref:Acetyltransferase n=1 Tax=Alicyclobacillus ferrooxydans TaxID=471514 RepID=A0A0P9D7G5_9BACL|nr:GNAT family N-acetyltransferase [Alicyclobacillus ferrooxydans]KPV45259.1 acetyltransferase [Alicyclobacillus ferrooxydans]
MNIRDALTEDLGFIREQRVHAYSEYAGVLPSSHWRALRQAISSNADAQPGVELIVAEVDGHIAGSVALFPAKSDAYEGMLEDTLDYPEIRMLAVGTDYRGQGIASALVTECINRSEAKGFRSVGLHTGEFMRGALQLYEKLGFERIPEFDFQPADDGITVKAFLRRI